MTTVVYLASKLNPVKSESKNELKVDDLKVKVSAVHRCSLHSKRFLPKSKAEITGI